jgi:hypothetical protein
VLQLLGVVALAACGVSPRLGEVDAALAQLRSAVPAERHEAVVRLGVLPPSEARRDGLAAAVRDDDVAVRLLAAIVIVGDGPNALAVSMGPPASSTPNPSVTPNPPARAHLSTTEALVYLDPGFAGTLLPGALEAARSRDERVRTLGQRALQELKREAPLDGSTPNAAPAAATQAGG